MSNIEITETTEVIEIDETHIEVITIGTQGPAGATGATGEAGATGQGVPIGGTIGQTLKKISAEDFATAWAGMEDVAISYEDGRISEVVKGGVTFVFSYTSGRLEQISNGTHSWAFG